MHACAGQDMTTSRIAGNRSWKCCSGSKYESSLLALVLRPGRRSPSPYLRWPGLRARLCSHQNYKDQDQNHRLPNMITIHWIRKDRNEDQDPMDTQGSERRSRPNGYARIGTRIKTRWIRKDRNEDQEDPMDKQGSERGSRPTRYARIGTRIKTQWIPNERNRKAIQDQDPSP